MASGGRQRVTEPHGRAGGRTHAPGVEGGRQDRRTDARTRWLAHNRSSGGRGAKASDEERANKRIESLAWNNDE